MEEKFYQCPYCWQNVSTLLDTGVDGLVELIDDCEVCCRPIEIHYRVEELHVVEFNYFSVEGNES